MRKIVFVLSLIAIAAPLLVWRNPLRGLLWHWKHGDTVAVGAYQAPVPASWMVLDQNEHSVLLMRTSLRVWQRRSLPVEPVLGITSTSIKAPYLDSWAAQREQRAAQSGEHVVEDGSWQLGDEKVVCLRSDYLKLALRDPSADIVSLECVSEGYLDVTFTGHESDVREFYDILMQIKKRPAPAGGAGAR